MLEMSIERTGCRICLKPEMIMLPLFQKISSTSNILYSDMLNYCTNLQVTFGDKLPNKMCLKCKRTLEICYNFKKLAEDSNNTLMRDLSTRHVNLKVDFDDMDDLKQKIDSKVLIEKVPKTETITILNSDGEVSICNTSIRKIKPSTSPIPEMEEEYLDFLLSEGDNDDDTDYVPAVKKSPKKASKTPKNASVKENIYKTVQIKIMNPEKISDTVYERKFPKKDAIPIRDRNNSELYYITKAKREKIMALLDHTSMTIREVADAVGVGRSSVSRVITGLKKSGCTSPWLERQRGRKRKTTWHDDQVLINSDEIKKEYPAARLRVVSGPRESSNGKKKSVPKRVIKVKRGSGNWDMDDTKCSKVNGEKRKEKEKHVCPVCGILTFTLAKHLMTHEVVKPFGCEVCKKTFSSKIYFEMHMKKHSGNKDQICEICGAAFYFVRSVIRHMLIHKGERPFPCTLCPKKFIANCDLTRHMKIHAGYKPFKCDTCTMTFNAKHQLANHNRMHTGEKPYTCEVCNVSFAYKVNLNNHVFKVHGINIRYKPVYTLTSEILSIEYAAAGEQSKSLPVLEYGEDSSL